MIVKEKRTEETREIPLFPKKNCRDCHGRGWLALINPGSRDMRDIIPCYCVRATVPSEWLGGKYDQQAIHTVKV